MKGPTDFVAAPVIMDQTQCGGCWEMVSYEVGLWENISSLHWLLSLTTISWDYKQSLLHRWYWESAKLKLGKLDIKT